MGLPYVNKQLDDRGLLKSPCITDNSSFILLSGPNGIHYVIPPNVGPVKCSVRHKYRQKMNNTILFHYDAVTIMIYVA